MTANQPPAGPACRAPALSRRSRALPGVVIGLTLAVFLGMLLLVGRQLRQVIRAEITSRDAEILQTAAMMQEFDEQTRMDPTEPADLAAQFTFLVTSSPKSIGMLASRLFDPAGRFVVAYPGYVARGRLEAADLPALERLHSVSRFHPAVSLSDLFRHPSNAAPGPATNAVLEVLIPIHTSPHTHLLGIAQFFLDGTAIASEFAMLDRHLFQQASIAFGVGSLIIVLALGWTFGRLQRANALLEERTADLVRANQELALAAKTSAVGALTAHLIHGLKNPLFGLQTLMIARRQEPAAGSDTEWKLAAATTARMEMMINNVLRVLREENSSASYELSLAELLEVLANKIQPLAAAVGVQFLTRRSAEGSLSNRDANLTLLILENLIHNAIQATRKGGTVSLAIEPAAENIAFGVRDEGGGFPKYLRNSLFSPCQSTKEGGNGIGLALSKQLANHLGAGLELRHAGPPGCVFVLTLPVRLCRAENGRPAPAATP